MLQNTFLHIPGISKETEQDLWRNNIYSWSEFLENYKELNLSSFKKERIHKHIKKSIKAYNKKDYQFFLDNLPPNLHWRVYPELKQKCCFLDIETTGLSKCRNDITLIGMYNGNKSKIFINGDNLDKFPKELNKYDMIVTFNGKCFDLPFIRSKFPELDINKFHIDLRFTMCTLGYSGGLKLIEKKIGITREEDLQDIDGFEAVRLWYKYKKGDLDALDLLIKYNKADIENLKTMMDFTFNQLKEQEFLDIIT